MIKSIIFRVTLAGVLALAASVALADQEFEALQANQAIADFRVESIYENAAGTAMGGRFRHVPSGFVLDMLRIQSVPQAFIWVNSPPPSDQGEPHTCEHLLLGKGTKGRYVASLEGMSLGKSSAFTMQLQTCYHFHTPAGTEVFLNLLEAKLDALLHPTFSDEEIRREVCNIGYTIDPVDSTLRLEEKGTVYNEMVSSYERPWSNLGLELGRMMYGRSHPLSNESGGLPAAIRTMTPDDLRRFHGKAYHLSNMGVIVSIPNDITLTDCLGKISAILARVEPDAQADQDPATLEERLPAPHPEPLGTIRQVSFPHQNEEEPGLLVFGWSPVLEMDNNEEYILDLFLENLAGGSTSNLYRKFIDSQTRVIDVGANSVFGWSSSDLGHPIYVGLNNVRREATEANMIDSIRTLILTEIERIAQFKDGSDELGQFNQRAQGLVIERRRDLEELLNSPPGFGFRNSGAQWFFHLKHLQNTTGFRKRLTLDSELSFAENLIGSGRNFWNDYIAKWGLLERTPYAVASRPDPELLQKTESARKDRLNAFLTHLQQEYGVSTKDEAKQRYRKEYDAKTAVIDEEAASIPMPEFVESTPQTLDDQLEFTAEKLPDGEPIVTSTFENMTSATAGLAFRMDVVPPDLLLYMSALPMLMTEVGVVRDGQAIPYDEMKEDVRREILELRTYYSTNYRTERIELTVRAAGSDKAEIDAAANWMAAVLFDPDWRPENLPRIRDAVDLELKSLRNTMRGSEESWVNDPANAYWRQTNPLLLAGDCFLTRTHALHRLRWRLKQAPSGDDERQFAAYLEQLAKAADGSDRDALSELTSALLSGEATDAPLPTPDELPAGARVLAMDALEDLKQSLSDIPDLSLTSDWQYLCRQMTADLHVAPETVLNDLHRLMNLIRRADNVRSFMIASSDNQAAMEPRIEALVGRLGQEPSIRQTYGRRPRIVARLQERTPNMGRPVYVGLINENTRSGVHINSATSASYLDTDREKLLDFLSARLYGGWGAHSMYMKTWAAGLAYSNGLRHNESTGRMIYYAERCPDLAQTMQFVVNELKNAPYDTSLAQYAIAQAYVGCRGGEGYEQRGEAMAADLADGVTPDKVTQFFDGVLALRDSRDLYGEIYGRMPYTYGKILPGYGQSGAEVSDAIYFVIGPETQFQSYEEYLRSVEDDVTLYRLYPRDFWLVDENLN
jgi:Zn-dependent M16 (insulinase) family peptidase